MDGWMDSVLAGCILYCCHASVKHFELHKPVWRMLSKYWKQKWRGGIWRCLKYLSNFKEKEIKSGMNGGLCHQTAEIENDRNTDTGNWSLTGLSCMGREMSKSGDVRDKWEEFWQCG